MQYLVQSIQDLLIIALACAYVLPLPALATVEASGTAKASASIYSVINGVVVTDINEVMISTDGKPAVVNISSESKGEVEDLNTIDKQDNNVIVTNQIALPTIDVASKTQTEVNSYNQKWFALLETLKNLLIKLYGG